jgi:hypothetical protein
VEVIEVCQHVKQLSPSSSLEKAVKQFVLPSPFLPVPLKELCQAMPAAPLYFWKVDVPPLYGAPNA